MERAIALFTSAITETRRERDAAVNECGMLRTQNATLREQVTAITRDNTRLTYENQRIKERQSNGKTLVIGSSLIRNFDENRAANTQVVCMRGAKVADVKTELTTITSDKGIKYEHIVLLCGGNNCAESDPKIDEIASAYRDLVQTAQSAASKVTVGSIPPRLEPRHANDAIHSLNAALQSLSADTGVIFANQHELFHLQNGNINDGYLADNVHLTMKGSDAMARKMGIKLRHGCAGVADARPKQTPPITWRKDKPTNNPATQRANQGPVHEYNEQINESQFFARARAKVEMNDNRQRNYKPQQRKETVGRYKHSVNMNSFRNVPRHGKNDGYKTRVTNSRDNVHSCSFCAEPNHNAQNCRHGQAIICHDCNWSGHKAKYCPQRYDYRDYRGRDGYVDGY